MIEKAEKNGMLNPKMDALKEIIFGEEIQVFQNELAEVKKKLAVAKSYFDDRINTIENKNENDLIKLQRDLGAKISDLEVKYKKEILKKINDLEKKHQANIQQILKDNQTDNYLLGKMLIKVGEKLLNKDVNIAE